VRKDRQHAVDQAVAQASQGSCDFIGPRGHREWIAGFVVDQRAHGILDDLHTSSEMDGAQLSPALPRFDQERRPRMMSDSTASHASSNVNRIVIAPPHLQIVTQLVATHISQRLQ
jgi:hypothetical protein